MFNLKITRDLKTQYNIPLKYIQQLNIFLFTFFLFSLIEDNL